MSKRGSPLSRTNVHPLTHRMIGALFTLWLPLPALADEPTLNFESHVNSSSDYDPNAGFLRITSTGGPVIILNLTLNGHCVVQFYQEVVRTLAKNGDVEAWALPDDKAPQTLAFLQKHGKLLMPVSLNVVPGDPVSVLIPAVYPLAAFAGYPGSGACGMTLDSLHAITSVGEVDWKTSAP